MTQAPHPLASGHLPFFITPPGGTDALMIIGAVFLVGSVLLAGVLFLHLHSLPERMAHKGQKLQFEIVAVLCLLALFTHTHAFWVVALLLAVVDLPDFLSPMNRIAQAAERIAGASSASKPPPEPHPDPAPKEMPPVNAPGHKAGGDHA